MKSHVSHMRVTHRVLFILPAEAGYTKKCKNIIKKFHDKYCQTNQFIKYVFKKCLSYFSLAVTFF